MPDVVADLAFSEGAGAPGSAALRSGAPILCDVRMVAAGLMTKRLRGKQPGRMSRSTRPARQSLPQRTGQTRSAAGMELAAQRA